MANNPYKNKIVYNGQTLIDLTGDTVSANKLAEGYTAHDASGAPIVGSYVPQSLHTATVTRADQTLYNDCYAKYDDVYYRTTATFSFVAGEICMLYAIGQHGGGDIYIDGVKVASSQAYQVTYNYTLPDYDINIVLTNGAGGRIDLTVLDIKAISITENGTYTAPTGAGYSPITVNVPTGGVIIEDTTDSHGGTIRTITSANAVTLGTKSITQNGTYAASSDSLNGYSSVTVDVPSGQPTLQSKSVNPTESSQTVTPDSGYDGLSSVSVGAISSTYVGSGITQRSSSDLSASGATVTAPAGYYSSAATKTVSSGSATAPATISGTSATVSTGTNTLTLSKTVSVTPSVTAGYVSSGTAGNSNVSLTASVTTQAAQTIYPSSSDQSIASGRYLTGAQTIKGVTTTNLTADNIKSGVTVQVGDSADSDRVLSVTGTYSGGGGSSDVAMGTLTVASNVNTSTSTKITDTTTIGFTPTKFFFWKEARTATSNHVHQATFTTMGSYYIRTMTRYSSNALSTSGNTNNWTTQTAGYLYYNSNTVYFRSSSSYILSSGTWYWVAVK